MYTLQGKPDQHVTRFSRSIHVWSTTIRISRGPHIATFHTVVNRFEQIHCTWEEGLLTQSTAWRPFDPQVRTQLLSHNSQRAVGKSQTPVNNRLLGLPGPYHRHTIGTFNTCSRGPTERFFLADTWKRLKVSTLDLAGAAAPLWVPHRWGKEYNLGKGLPN
jgi:hypothetical protein